MLLVSPLRGWDNFHFVQIAPKAGVMCKYMLRLTAFFTLFFPISCLSLDIDSSVSNYICHNSESSNYLYECNFDINLTVSDQGWKYIACFGELAYKSEAGTNYKGFLASLNRDLLAFPESFETHNFKLEAAVYFPEELAAKSATLIWQECKDINVSS